MLLSKLLIWDGERPTGTSKYRKRSSCTRGCDMWFAKESLCVFSHLENDNTCAGSCDGCKLWLYWCIARYQVKETPDVHQIWLNLKEKVSLQIHSMRICAIEEGNLYAYGIHFPQYLSFTYKEISGCTVYSHELHTTAVVWNCRSPYFCLMATAASPSSSLSIHVRSKASSFTCDIRTRAVYSFSTATACLWGPTTKCEKCADQHFQRQRRYSRI